MQLDGGRFEIDKPPLVLINMFRGAVRMEKAKAGPLKKKFLHRNILCACSKNFTKPVHAISEELITEMTSDKGASLYVRGITEESIFLVLASTKIKVCGRCKVIFACCKICGETSTWKDIKNMFYALYNRLMDNNEIDFCTNMFAPNVKFPLITGMKLPYDNSMSAAVDDNFPITYGIPFHFNMQGDLESWSVYSCDIFPFSVHKFTDLTYVYASFSKREMQNFIFEAFGKLNISLESYVNTFTGNMSKRLTSESNSYRDIMEQYFAETLEEIVIRSAKFICAFCESAYLTFPTTEIISHHLGVCKKIKSITIYGEK